MNEKDFCKYCGVAIEYTFVPFANPQHKSPFDPLWQFHIGVVCQDRVHCGKFNGWRKQTPEFMKMLKNSILVLHHD